MLAPHRRFVAWCLVSLWVGGCHRTSRDWPMHRYNAARTANQPNKSALSDPARVPSLHEIWRWHPAAIGDQDLGATGPGFSASPVVYRGRVYLGHLNGRLYALDTSGTFLWKYPPAGAAALVSTSMCNPSSPGIASTPAIAANIGGSPAVVFGAPDPASANGDGRVWAVNATTGTLIWRSPVVASRFNNEQIGYDSPVIANGRVYIGISNHCDNPIIAGKLFALDLATGAFAPGFSTFVASATRGGGLWSSPAAAQGDVVVTTGNGCVPTNGGCGTEPSPNHALSMIRLDGTTGAMIWKFQPVPWALDYDPDWAAIPAFHAASCGRMMTAPMKDGYTHALNAGPAAPTGGDPAALGLSLRRWTFPQASIPFSSGSHGDIRYTRGAAVWNDVVFAVTGGRDVTVSVTAGYSRLHALNACASDHERVRWWLQFPGYGYPTLGSPSVTRGIVYVGTTTDTLYAIADPDLVPAAGSQCDFPGVAVADCAANGFRLTPIPAVLARVRLSGHIRTTPALARGWLLVTTDAGFVHALKP